MTYRTCIKLAESETHTGVSKGSSANPTVNQILLFIRPIHPEPFEGAASFVFSNKTDAGKHLLMFGGHTAPLGTAACHDCCVGGEV